MDHHVEEFTACWHREAPRVLAYARRHLGPDEAADVVAETFLVAWRRWDDVPEPPIGWLLRTAAGVIKNRTRSARRRTRLTDRVALLSHASAAAPDIGDAVAQREEALRRLAALTDDQREALLLVSWDGLSADAAAEVLCLRPATFRKRLSRARQLLDQDDPSPGPRRTPLLMSVPTTQQETP